MPCQVTKKIKRPALINIPEQIWALDLFSNPTDFPANTTGLEVERIELHCRHLKKMPTSTLAAEQAISTQTAKLLETATKWLEHSTDPNAQYTAAFLKRLQRTQQSFSMNAAAHTKASALAYLAQSLPEKYHRFIPSTDSGTLGPLMFAMLEDGLKLIPDLFCRYRKKLFKISDTLLEYNPTTDQTRVLPLVNWIRLMLEQQGRKNLSFADIGCAAASGAKELLTLKQILSPNNLCVSFDGSDITKPDPKLQRAMIKQNKIRIYQNDILTQPLPQKYDVLLVANLNRLLSKKLQISLIKNAAKSLHQLGVLFINWRFDTNINSSVCLQRHREHLAFVCHNTLPC